MDENSHLGFSCTSLVRKHFQELVEIYDAWILDAANKKFWKEITMLTSFQMLQSVV